LPVILSADNKILPVLSALVNHFSHRLSAFFFKKTAAACLYRGQGDSLILILFLSCHLSSTVFSTCTVTRQMVQKCPENQAAFAFFFLLK
jgi:hypothetical protein